MKGKLLKTLAILGCFALSMSVVACGGGDGKNDGGSSASSRASIELSSSEESSEIESSETEISSSEESSEEIVDEEILVGTEGLVYTLNEVGDGYIVTGYEGTDTALYILHWRICLL